MQDTSNYRTRLANQQLVGDLQATNSYTQPYQSGLGVSTGEVYTDPPLSTPVARSLYEYVFGAYTHMNSPTTNAYSEQPLKRYRDHVLEQPSA